VTNILVETRTSLLRKIEHTVQLREAAMARVYAHDEHLIELRAVLRAVEQRPAAQEAKQPLEFDS
jgi:hypothetical protein